jgi:predicted DNA-binding protein
MFALFISFLIEKNIKELEDYCFDFAFDNLKEVKKSEAINQMDEKSEKKFKFKVFDKF